MACVTLKRPVDVLGSPHVEQQPLPKRKRCGPPLFPSTPPSESSPGKSFKKRKRFLEVEDMPVSPPANTKQLVSPFLQAAPPLYTDKLVASIEAELKRLQRRKLFNESQGSHMTLPVSSPTVHGKDQPLFTLKQVTMVCQRMMKEREELVREEYDKVLSAKLAEQYDAFVKFSHDQVERRLTESTFSYVS